MVITENFLLLSLEVWLNLGEFAQYGFFIFLQKAFPHIRNYQKQKKKLAEFSLLGGKYGTFPLLTLIFTSFPDFIS